MKTTIEITGQPSGNFILKNALKPYMFDAEVKAHFNNFIIEYKTKKDAIASLKMCIKTLNQDREPNEPRYGHLKSLSCSYDASFLRII